MRSHRAVLLMVLVLVLAGCRNPYLVAQRFDDTYREYNRLVRWQEYRNACQSFADPGVAQECLARAGAAKGASMADYRVKGVDIDPAKGTATVRVEFDYYVLPSTRLKTLEDVQEWRYGEVDGAARWRIVTPLPDFR
uniref:Lipoprotein n=1 Tax=Geobacter metallireducens TaxID=28232 RepID=A0A831U354_GEOME